MQYLKKEQLISKALERAIDESSKDFEQALAESESEHIAIFKSLLKRFYNVEAIFDKDKPIYNPLLGRILTFLVLSDVFSRNAYRKYNANSFTEKNKEWAEKELEKLSKGIIILEDLPKKPDDPNNKKADSIFGNLRNEDFYI
jgi:hypothetical protein